MNDWMSESAAVVAPASPMQSDRALRALDVLLATALILPLLLPLWALRRFRRGTPAQGVGGVPFDRLSLALPAARWSCLLHALGASHWPVLLNILRGDMAWVGPRARAPGETGAGAAAVVRPGLVNPWFLRRRTAVDFGTEQQADAQYLAARGLGHDLGLLLRGALVAWLPPAAPAVPGRVLVGDVCFDNVDMPEALRRIGAMLDAGAPRQVSFVNPACVNIAARHRGYRRVLARAGLVLPDGIGIKIAGAMLGTPLKQNVNGTDLFAPLCEALQARGASVYLLGGQPGVAAAVAERIGARWPALRVAGQRDGFFGVAQEGAVAAAVRGSGADVLLVARGVPAQDLFIDRYLPLLGVKVAMGVGGLFDFVSERISRAPMWMRETGLEWIWRLMQEPGRMWRRYLVGNLTFLLRVALQRAGVRRAAADVRPAARELAHRGPAARAVVLATELAGADIPVPRDLPAALLPLGTHTVAEHLMARLAEAGIDEVDLVVCDRPELLRRLLGDGARWGLRLRLHPVKDPVRPYGVLRRLAPGAGGRVVLGHASQVPSVGLLQRLAAGGGLAFEPGAETGPRWTGWAGIDEACASALGGEVDRQALGAALVDAGAPQLMADGCDIVSVAGAAQLLQGQPGSNGELQGHEVPASWIRTPWGAMSPQAVVDAGATMHGPALVGPGCVVQRGATIGPGVVLSRDVVVSSGTRIERSLVLPDSFVGADLELASCVVNGNRVRHLALGVETALNPLDAVLLSMAPQRSNGPVMAGRATALLALACAALPLAALVATRRLTGRGLPWARRPVVCGRDDTTQKPRVAHLVCALPNAGAADLAWVGMAGLLDVVRGRRSWFGMRARSLGQWYSLRPAWQQVLADMPVGLLHAPAWADPLHMPEAEAAADVFAATQPRRWSAWQAIRSLPG